MEGYRCRQPSFTSVSIRHVCRLAQAETMAALLKKTKFRADVVFSQRARISNTVLRRYQRIIESTHQEGCGCVSWSTDGVGVCAAISAASATAPSIMIFIGSLCATTLISIGG
jgi:hypothetical protein